jgi:hypothetical protein
MLTQELSSIPRASCIGETLLDGATTDTNDGTKVAYTLTNGSYATTQVGYQKQHAVFGATTSFTRASLASIQTLAVAVYPTAASKTLFTYVTTTGLVTFDASYVVSTSGISNATIYVNGVQSSTLTANAWNLLIITHDAATATNFNLGSSSFLGNACMLRAFNTKLTEIERAQLFHEFNRKLGGGSDFGAVIPAPKYGGLSPNEECYSQLVATTLGSPSNANDEFGIQTAKSLDGVDDGYVYASGASLSSGQSITCMAMINGNSAPATTGSSTFEYASAFLSGPANASGPWSFSWNSPSSSFVGAASVWNGTTSYAAKFGTINASTWYCLALKWDSSTNRLRSYKDGVFQNETATSGSIPASSNIRFSVPDQGYFPGKIGQWAIWNSALSDAQIALASSMMRSGRYPYAFRRSIPQVLSPAIYIDKFDATTAYDVSGGGRNLAEGGTGSPIILKAFQNEAYTNTGGASYFYTSSDPLASQKGRGILGLTVVSGSSRLY